MATTETTATKPAEEDMVDVFVVLNVSTPQEVPAAVAQARSAGLTVVQVDDQNGVIEGVARANDLEPLRRLPAVRCVWLWFEYIAERAKKKLAAGG